MKLATGELRELVKESREEGGSRSRRHCLRADHPVGTPAKLLAASRSGGFELIVSPLLLEELCSVLRQKMFRRYVALDVVAWYVDLLRRDAAFADDPTGPPPIRCRNPDDDYLIALAHARAAALFPAMTTSSSSLKRSRY